MLTVRMEKLADDLGLNVEKFLGATWNGIWDDDAETVEFREMDENGESYPEYIAQYVYTNGKLQFNGGCYETEKGLWEELPNNINDWRELEKVIKYCAKTI